MREETKPFVVEHMGAAAPLNEIDSEEAIALTVEREINLVALKSGQFETRLV